MQKLTVKGVLPVGVVVNGRLCNAVTLREANFRDSLKASNPTDNVDPNLYYPKVATIAACLTIDGVPSNQINHDFVLDLDEEDGEYLFTLKEQLTVKKKEQVHNAAILTA